MDKCRAFVFFFYILLKNGLKLPAELILFTFAGNEDLLISGETVFIKDR